MPSLPPRVRFTLADAERAHDEWGCNCGPGALAAIIGMTLDEVRPHMGDFESKGYTNPTLMIETLERASVRFRSRGLASNVPTLGFPRYGLARIQWEGPWTKPGVPMRARYRHTHWVGACARNPDNIGIFDINCMNNGNGWVALSGWRDVIVPYILETCVPRANGKWHITHAIEINPACLNHAPVTDGHPSCQPPLMNQDNIVTKSDEQENTPPSSPHPDSISTDEQANQGVKPRYSQGGT